MVLMLKPAAEASASPMGLESRPEVAKARE
jgi:hypothetical protein